MLSALFVFGLAVNTQAPLASPPQQVEIFGNPIVSLAGPFDRVRGAGVLSDGKIAVANGGDRQIHLYSRSGQLLRRIGRSGEGPSEFRHITSLIVDSADSLFVLDWLLERISVFSPDGTFVRSIRTPALSAARSVPALLGFLGDGMMLVSRETPIDPQKPPGVQRSVVTYELLNKQGFVVDTLATAPGIERWVRPRPPGFLTANVPFGKTTSIAITGFMTVALADAGNGRIQHLRSDGRLLRTEIAPWPESRVSAEEIGQYKKWRLESVPMQARPAEERTLSEIPIPERKPGLGRVYGVGDGRLLVEKYRAFAGAPTEALLLSDRGAVAAKTRIPADTEIIWAGRGLVVAINRDDLGVETVAVYRIP